MYFMAGQAAEIKDSTPSIFRVPLPTSKFGNLWSSSHHLNLPDWLARVALLSIAEVALQALVAPGFAGHIPGGVLRQVGPQSLEGYT